MNKVVKSVAALALSMCTGVVSFGKTVDENTAKTTGCNYLISVGVQGVKTPEDLAINYTATAEVGGKQVVDYYVFNIKNAPGFVMVSGDDLVIPILAYSNEQPFDMNTISPDAKWWIEGYQNQITWVIEHQYPAQPGTPESWADLKIAKAPGAAKTTAVTPLLSTTWDQAGGGAGVNSYNAQCPGVGVGKTYTGCVATSMSQIMKFWNWPPVGCGAHTYTQNPNPSGYPAQNVDFGNTLYNWSAMPMTNSNTSVAQIMYHAGVSVEMNYSTTESGAYVVDVYSPVRNDAEFAFKTYFHYKRTLKGIARSYPTVTPTATWVSMLQAELNAGRPVLYTGSSITAGGHAWVCDGWQVAGNKFHMNWGWSGTGPDGYYTVDALSPPALGIGGGGGNFNNNQAVIIGIQPDSFPSNPGNIQMQTTLDCPVSLPIQYDAGFTFSTKLTNTASTAFNGDICAQVFDTSDNLVGTIQTLTGQSIGAGANSAPLSFATTGMLALIPMNYYHVRVMCRATGTSTWVPAANNGAYKNYNVISVVNSQLIELADSIHPTSYNIVRGTSLHVTTKITNPGSTDFTGTVQAILVNVATGISYPVQVFTGQTIFYGSTNSFNFNLANVTAPSGTYILAIQHQPTGAGGMIYTGSDVFENPVIVHIIGGVSISTPSSAAENVIIYPNPANDVINIDLQGADVSEIRIIDMQGREMQKINPAANQSLINISTAAFAPGVYMAQLQAGGAVVTRKIVVTK